MFEILATFASVQTFKSELSKGPEISHAIPDGDKRWPKIAPHDLKRYVEDDLPPNIGLKHKLEWFLCSRPV